MTPERAGAGDRGGPFPPYGRTIRVEGGLKAQSTRGAIGESWWSKRFIAVLESLALGSRLTRGRNYARAGQVLSLDITPGEVTASVQGSRPTPYEVSIGLAALGEPAWQAVEAALAEQALFSARLLAGEMPTQIEEVFAEAGTPLFPTRAGQLAMHCSCPDWTVPCKHIAATFYLLAEAFDADPFQILHWRGRDRATLLARLGALRSGIGADDEDDDSGTTAAVTRSAGRRSARAGSTGARSARAGSTPGAATLDGTTGPSAASRSGPAGAARVLAELSSPDLAETVDRFWVPPVPLPARPPTLTADVDLLLRQLPAPAAELGGSQLTDQLRALYAVFGKDAATETDAEADG
ncbi:MAG TPA: hypothetical protein VF163_02500 [Micromonosporaceae bacterium]